MLQKSEKSLMHATFIKCIYVQRSRDSGGSHAIEEIYSQSSDSQPRLCLYMHGDIAYIIGMKLVLQHAHVQGERRPNPGRQFCMILVRISGVGMDQDPIKHSHGFDQIHDGGMRAHEHTKEAHD